MIALKRDPDVRRPRANPGLDRDTFVRPIAHRGLHDRDAGRIENTAPAFLAAIDKGYGIECDLQPADDGTPMVFHDDEARPPGCSHGADRRPARQRCCRRFRYKGQDQKILTFAQFLDLVDGRVPLLVEVKGKTAGADAAFLEKIARQARAYKGPIALMSFNRARRRGAGRACADDPARSDRRQPASCSRACGRQARDAREPRGLARVRIGAGGVGFYAVDVNLVAVARKWMSRHAPELPLFTWTVRTPRQRAAAARWADAPIFEGYEA